MGTVLWATLVAYGALYVAWRIAAHGPGVSDSLANRLAFGVPGLFVLALSWRAARRTELRADRRAWNLLAGAYLAFVCGNLFWLVTHFWRAPGAGLEIAHFGWLLYYPLLLAGILSFPRPAQTRTERLQFWIDAAAIACGGAMLIVYLAGFRVAGRDLGEVLLVLAYPVGDVLLLLGVAVLALRRRDEPARPTYVFLATALLTELGANLMWGTTGLAGTTLSSLFQDGFYMAAWVFRGSAAWVYPRRSTAATVETPYPDPAGLSVLPYGAALVGYVTLVLGLEVASLITMRALVFGAALLTGLALLSLWVTSRDNLRLQTDHAVRRSEARFRSLVQSTSDLIAVVDESGFLRYLAPSAETILGRGATHHLGHPFESNVHPEDRERLRLLLAQAMAHPGVCGPVELRVDDGTDGWIATEALATNLLDDPDLDGLVLNLRDIRLRKQLEEQLLHRALHDPLTTLANRALFSDRLDHALARNRGDNRCAVALVDLDDFKAVNDSLGHAAGDLVLVEIGRRLRSVIRAADTGARLGGDEFAVLLEEIEDESAAREAAERVLQATAAPFAIGSREIRLGVSIGIAIGGPGDTGEDVMRRADLALYHAKDARKGGLVLFEPGMQSEMLRRHAVESELRHAITAGHLQLHFQPICSLRSGRVVGTEALVRWRHPKRGLLAPQHFIEDAERSGLIEPLGDWVVEEACRHTAAWNAIAPRPLHVGVNLSLRQLQNPQIVDVVRHALGSTGLTPNCLVFEITESLVASDPVSSVGLLHQLRSAGALVALDDFGTGYSSLSRLRDLPLDLLKVDRGFARDLARPQGQAITAAVVHLAKALELLVVAEGIETVDQAATLRDLGCDLGQGFHFAPPVDAAVFAERYLHAAGPTQTT